MACRNMNFSTYPGPDTEIPWMSCCRHLFWRWLTVWDLHTKDETRVPCGHKQWSLQGAETTTWGQEVLGSASGWSTARANCQSNKPKEHVVICSIILVPSMGWSAFKSTWQIFPSSRCYSIRVALARQTDVRCLCSQLLWLLPWGMSLAHWHPTSWLLNHFMSQYTTYSQLTWFRIYLMAASPGSMWAVLEGAHVRIHKRLSTWWHCITLHGNLASVHGNLLCCGRRKLKDVGKAWNELMSQLISDKP